ncbi:hypothetical protein RHMOL_Rhmol01G0174700 [Rhododendron molle]|uniref:Uncharacterized protein n=1 Tax=Rhododendron molle TaxID=49168 RepID=A0ACC0Q308_RHOML|nr:hypothetical protein RHMOL_Rhmol01G0174700 [Rhododendron molle]
MMLWCPQSFWGHRNNWHDKTIMSIIKTIQWHNQAILSFPVLFSSSIPSVDVAPAPTTNNNGISPPSDDPNSNPDSKPTFNKNKAKILRLKLPHAHVQPSI